MNDSGKADDLVVPAKPPNNAAAAAAEGRESASDRHLGAWEARASVGMLGDCRLASASKPLRWA
jgi:hypothetical protein